MSDEDFHTTSGCKDSDEFKTLKEEFHKLKYKCDGNGTFGIFQKVDIMWRVHVWLLCGFSTIVGAIIASLFNRFFINK